MDARQAKRRQGRPPKRVDPDTPLGHFVTQLRLLKEKCGEPSYVQMKNLCNYSRSKLSDAARGDKLPRWEVVHGYVRACVEYASLHGVHGNCSEEAKKRAVENHLCKLEPAWQRARVAAKEGHPRGPESDGEPASAAAAKSQHGVDESSTACENDIVQRLRRGGDQANPGRDRSRRWPPIGRVSKWMAVVLLVVVLGAAGAIYRVVESDNDGSVLLQRWKSPKPGMANYVSTDAEGPPGWIPLAPIGRVYPPGSERASGLVPIYLYKCSNGCDGREVYRLSRNAGASNKNWDLVGEAFRCFGPNGRPSKTRRLLSLMIFSKERPRVWVVEGTPEYEEAVNSGFVNPNNDEFDDGVLCYIW